jgi:hypothetical protein
MCSACVVLVVMVQGKVGVGVLTAHEDEWQRRHAVKRKENKNARKKDMQQAVCVGWACVHTITRKARKRAWCP